MPITRTAIVDDNGTGTTGTILNNAWKQELYGQIDSSVPSVLVKQNYAAANTATGYTALGALTMPPLGLNDTVKIIASLIQLEAPRRAG